MCTISITAGPLITRNLPSLETRMDDFDGQIVKFYGEAEDILTHVPKLGIPMIMRRIERGERKGEAKVWSCHDSWEGELWHGNVVPACGDDRSGWRISASIVVAYMFIAVVGMILAVGVGSVTDAVFASPNS
jgi:hypothetical protein